MEKSTNINKIVCGICKTSRQHPSCYCANAFIRQPCLHCAIQAKQPVHSAGSTVALKFSTFTAPFGHAFTQRIHPIQPAVQALFVSAPLSQLLQRTTACCFTGARRISPFGQASAHFPHALQRAGFMRASPLHIVTASYSQAALQSPNPIHP